MAYETGTASNHSDLLAKLKTFLTTNSALVAAGQQWQSLRYTAGSELLLKGTGLSGADQIFVNIKDYVDTNDDIYNWVVQGAGGYISTNAVDDQPAQSPKVGLSLWNDPMTYWFVANGRRFIVVAKVSTYYVAGYFGLALPFGSPLQYPYPMIVAGNLPNRGASYNTKNYSWGQQLNTNYWNPGAFSASGYDVSDASNTFVYWLDGSWRYLKNFYTSGQETGSFELSSIVADTNFMAPVRPDWLRDCIDGSYILTPHTVVMGMPSNALMGELDGSFSISGFSNGSENTVTIGSDTYLVVQNVYRNAVKDFAAIKLA